MSDELAEPEITIGASSTPVEHPVSRRRTWVVAMAGGLIALVLSWGAGEATVEIFKGKEVKNPLAETVDMADTDRVAVKNAIVSWGFQGALLGLTLGIAGAVARRSPRAALSSGLVGLFLGGVLGSLSTYAVFTTYFALVDGNSQDMIPALLAHASVASLIGASAGVAFGLGRGGRGVIIRTAFGGLCGAILGSCLYEVLGALLFPVDKTTDPVAASSLARLLCHGLIALFVAMSVAATAESRAAAAKPGPIEPALS